MTTIPPDSTLDGLWAAVEEHPEEWHRWGVLADRLRDLGCDEYADGAMWQMRNQKRPCVLVQGTYFWFKPKHEPFSLSGLPSQVIAGFRHGEYREKPRSRIHPTFQAACIALWDALIRVREEQPT